YWSRGASTDMHVVCVLLAFLLLAWSVKVVVHGPRPTLIYWSRGATVAMHVVRVFLYFLLLTWSVKAAVYGPQPTLHILTFCPSNCDSTATSWTNPVGASNATASYCGAG